MNLPWNKTIPRQMTTDDFSEEGVKCPYCGEYKQFLVSIVLAEGMDYICEECRKHETLADLSIASEKTHSFRDGMKASYKKKREVTPSLIHIFL